jgi:hypothetical protein
LASINAISILLQAGQESLVEAGAGVLLNLLLLIISGLSVLNWGSLHHGGSLLNWSLLNWGLTVATAATSHNSSDSLMSDFRTSTHSHTSGKSAS